MKFTHVKLPIYEELLIQEQAQLFIDICSKLLQKIIFYNKFIHFTECVQLNHCKYYFFKSQINYNYLIFI